MENDQLPFYCPECKEYSQEDPVIFRGQTTHYCPICGYIGEDGSGESRYFDLTQPAPNRLKEI